MKELQESLPAEPMAMLAAWLDDAMQAQRTPNPNAIVVSTVARQKGEILPSARVVLCKEIDTQNGYLVFYTNYLSRKGRELEHTPHAAAVFHWDTVGRQARIEGVVVPSPALESDAYFASRGRGSQIGAWASEQSEPIASRTALIDQVEKTKQRFGTERAVPRPPHWGGYRLWASAVELWVHGENRIHDRARWIRTVAMDDNGQPHPGQWSVTRLQP